MTCNHLTPERLMTLMSLTAYAATHSASRQAAKKWQDRGYLVMQGDQVDAAASDAKMQAAGKGRFRVKAHGGRRTEGVRGLIDRPGMGYVAGKPVEVLPAPSPWAGWHRLGNPNTMSTQLRTWIESGDEADRVEALDAADHAAWDEACKDAGWDRWPGGIAAAVAADLGIPGRVDAVQAVLHRHVRARLASLEIFEQDLTDPRLTPR
jgi:hypothetical protein